VYNITINPVSDAQLWVGSVKEISLSFYVPFYILLMALNDRPSSSPADRFAP